MLFCLFVAAGPVETALGVLPQCLGQSIGQARFPLDRAWVVLVDDQGHALGWWWLLQLQQRSPKGRRLIAAQLVEGMALGPLCHRQTLLRVRDQPVDLIHPGLLGLGEQGVLPLLK